MFLKQNPTVKPANLSIEDAIRDNRHIFEALSMAPSQTCLSMPRSAQSSPPFGSSTRASIGAPACSGTYPPGLSYTARLTERCNEFDRAAVAQEARTYKP
jgi:hypothetical protein